MMNAEMQTALPWENGKGMRVLSTASSNQMADAPTVAFPAAFEKTPVASLA
jgi:hypothetical protein